MHGDAPEEASYKLSNKLKRPMMTGNKSKPRHFVTLCTAFGVVPVDFGSIASCDRLSVHHLHTSFRTLNLQAGICATYTR
jgi:hypothetical protein